MLATLLATALAALPLPLGDEHDLLVFADGKEVPCRILLETENKVVYRARNRTSEVPRAALKEVQSAERSLREFLGRFEAIDPRDVAALAELAAFAEARYLAGEAHATWIRILTIDPENEEAWTRLGGVQRRTGWELRVRGRFYTLEELRTRASDWQNALELRSAHFLIRTDGPPERALDLALDVERAYLTFYDVFGKPLELYVFDEVPEIHINADPKDYRSPPVAGRAAWFERNANVLHVNGQQASERGTIIAEFADALVFNSFRRTLARTGELEPWAREGLRQAFAAAARPDPGRLVFDFASPYLPHFQAHARDPKPLSLSQVLRAGLASFDSGSDQGRHVAQSYTLLHFLAFYENQKHRLGLANFLRESYQGKGGTSNFLKALGVDEKTLEAEWSAHVKAAAGG